MNETKIIQTKDPGVILTCAQMMASNDPWITLGFDLRGCLEAFRGDFREIHVAKKADEIAGFVILQVWGTFSGYIQTICISEKYRGKGMGTELLLFCENRILRFSPNIFICVSEFNEGAKRLYLKLGFKIVGELENFVSNGFTEILMRKTVGPRAGYKSS